MPTSSSDHWPRPQHGPLRQVRVPVLVSTGRLFKLPEELLGLWVDAQTALTCCGAAEGSGLGLKVDPEPVLQSRVDLDRWHSPLLIGATQEALSVLWVNLPKTSFPGLVLLPRHLDEALVEGQVVSDGVLKTETHIFTSSHQTYSGPLDLSGTMLIVFLAGS